MNYFFVRLNLLSTLLFFLAPSTVSISSKIFKLKPAAGTLCVCNNIELPVIRIIDTLTFFYQTLRYLWLEIIEAQQGQLEFMNINLTKLMHALAPEEVMVVRPPGLPVEKEFESFEEFLTDEVNFTAVVS